MTSTSAIGHADPVVSLQRSRWVTHWNGSAEHGTRYGLVLVLSIPRS